MHTAPDAALVGKAKGGDVAAFEAILGSAIEPAYRLACALLHDPDLAEDAVQEASVRAWRKLKRLHSERPFLPWFLGIVARQCHDQVRGRWWQVIRVPAPTLVPPTELPEEAAVRYRPAPWLLATSIVAVRQAEPRRRPWAWAVGALAIILALGTVAVSISIRAGLVLPARTVPCQTSHGLPDPIPQPITRTSPGAQIAWLFRASSHT